MTFSNQINRWNIFNVKIRICISYNHKILGYTVGKLYTFKTLKYKLRIINCQLFNQFLVIVFYEQYAISNISYDKEVIILNIDCLYLFYLD